jgi:hypothetical protein
MQKFSSSLIITAVIGLFVTGCATYQQQNRGIANNLQQGNLTNAIVEVTKKADENANGKNAIIWRLEEAATLRVNGQYDDSNKAFDIAQEKIDDYAQKAKVSISHEAGALLSNQANLPYEGRAYDGIMLNTYEALNYLALGEPDKARPELIRAYQRQQDAVEENKRRIATAQAEVARAGTTAITNSDAAANTTATTNQTSVAVEKAQKDPKFQAAIKSNYTYLDTLKPYANYVNPFTVYLDGLFFMANAADTSDLERAHKSFERVQGFIGDNDYIKQDLAAVDDLMNAKHLTPTTYVIFETGSAPERGQIRIDIPIIVSKVSYVGAAFPTLQMQNNYVPSLTVAANGTNVTTTLLASMDSVIGLDFKNELPIITTKTIVATVTKAVAAYAVNNAASQGSDIAVLITKFGTTIYQAAVNIADERTWTTLPKEFRFCRVATPPDRKIELATPDGSQKIPVTVCDGTINIIYVKSISPGTPLLVTQMKLK